MIGVILAIIELYVICANWVLIATSVRRFDVVLGLSGRHPCALARDVPH
jgi:hypothetical protein